VPIEEHGFFRNRKKYISQNVLAVVNFDLTFSYALCGWEGSAHDSRVLDDARAKGLPFILGKFYIGDCGHALSSTVLTPYRGVRYHLEEWALGNRKPQNAKEIFHLRHSFLPSPSLPFVFECCIAVGNSVLLGTVYIVFTITFIFPVTEWPRFIDRIFPQSLII
jgi:DDE superfamily endonuclease